MPYDRLLPLWRKSTPSQMQPCCRVSSNGSAWPRECSRSSAPCPRPSVPVVRASCFSTARRRRPPTLVSLSATRSSTVRACNAAVVPPTMTIPRAWPSGRLSASARACESYSRTTSSPWSSSQVCLQCLLGAGIGWLTTIRCKVGVHVTGCGPRTAERALVALLNAPRPGSKPFVERDDTLPMPHAVHRLDARVGGVLLVAKTRRLEVLLAAQLERHSITKRYRAIVVGQVTRELLNELGGGDPELALPPELEDLQSELSFVQDVVDGRRCCTAVRVCHLSRRYALSLPTRIDQRLTVKCRQCAVRLDLDGGSVAADRTQAPAPHPHGSPRTPDRGG